MSIKLTVIATLCWVQIILCIVGLLSFFGIIGSVPSTEKVYYYAPLCQELLHNNLKSLAESVETNPNGLNNFDIRLNDSYGIYLDVDSSSRSVSFRGYYLRNSSFDIRQFSRPEFPFPIYHQLKVTRLVEDVVFKDIKFRSETTKFEDSLSSIYYLLVMSTGYQLLLVPFSISFLSKSLKKKQIPTFAPRITHA